MPSVEEIIRKNLIESVCLIAYEEATLEIGKRLSDYNEFDDISLKHLMYLQVFKQFSVTKKAWNALCSSKFPITIEEVLDAVDIL
jgi:hypothetical protein